MYHSACRILARFILLAAVTQAAHVQASTPVPADPVATSIAAELGSLMSPEATLLQGVPIAMQEIIHAFYARRAFRPAWGNADNAAELRRALADSAADGLDPADYELGLLTRLG